MFFFYEIFIVESNCCVGDNVKHVVDCHMAVGIEFGNNGFDGLGFKHFWWDL